VSADGVSAAKPILGSTGFDGLNPSCRVMTACGARRNVVIVGWRHQPLCQLESFDKFCKMAPDEDHVRKSGPVIMAPRALRELRALGCVSAVSVGAQFHRCQSPDSIVSCDGFRRDHGT